MRNANAGLQIAKPGPKSNLIFLSDQMVGAQTINCAFDFELESLQLENVTGFLVQKSVSNLNDIMNII